MLVLAVALGLSGYQQVVKQESSASVGCGTITSAYLATSRWVSRNPVLMLVVALLQQPNYLSTGGQGGMAWIHHEHDVLTEMNSNLSFAGKKDGFQGHHVLWFGCELFPTGSYV